MASRSKCREKSSDGKLGERRDRISSLPDEVIVQILSFLPTKNAVGTSILAHRWRYLFTKVTNLDFDETLVFNPNFSLEHLEFARLNAGRVNLSDPDNSLPNQEQQRGFKDFVDRVMRLHNSTTINKFRLKCARGFDCSNVKAWIQAALLRGVEDLDISTHHYGSSILPDSIFTSEKLAVLKLQGNFVIKFPSLVHFPKLKSLHLSSVRFSDDRSVSSFMSGCPILEKLVIRGVWEDINEISISSTSLRILTLDFKEGFVGGPFSRSNVTLDLPNLVRFKYADYLATNYVLKNFNALEEARIEVWLDPEEFETVCNSVLGIINGVSKAKNLYLSGKCMEALSRGEFELPIFCNLTVLELGCTKHVEWRDVLCEFLHSSPMLEDLIFPEGLFDRPCYRDDDDDDDDDSDSDSDGWSDKNFWSKEQKSPVCLSSHLKIVIIDSFTGSEEELRIAKYILKHGKVLQELILDWQIGSKRDRTNFRALKKARKANKGCSVELE